jgi:glutamate racemase
LRGEHPIKKIMPNKCNIIFPGPIVAESFKEYLGRHAEIEVLLEKNKSRKFLTTGNVDEFNELSSMFLGYTVNSEKVVI